MKQNKRTTILKLALLVVCIAVLVAALAACNGKSGNTDSNPSDSDGIMPTEKALDSYVGYVLDGGSKSEEGSFAIGVYNIGNIEFAQFSFADEIDGEWHESDLFVCYDKNDSGDLATYLSNDSSLDEYTVSPRGDGSVLLETHKGYYDNVILKSKIPSNILSKKKMNIIHDAYAAVCQDVENGEQNIWDLEFFFTYYDCEEIFSSSIQYKNSNFSKLWAFSNQPDNNGAHISRAEAEECSKHLHEFFTEDSYVEFDDDERAFYYVKLIDKTDVFRYEDNPDGTISITNYITNTPHDKLVVPSTIGGKRVKSVGFEWCLFGIKAIEIPSGVEMLDRFDCYDLEELILPATLIGIYGTLYNNDRCPSLKTIKYGGSKAEWENLTRRFGRPLRNLTIECNDDTIIYSEQ